jgi:hypothetical protein
MCRNRTHPTPSEVTTVLKTAPDTSLDALPLADYTNAVSDFILFPAAKAFRRGRSLPLLR